jgi:2-polyprenyl-6-methoxyphenol hydroxylase-like FAD-dependent oxidoreductase
MDVTVVEIANRMRGGGYMIDFFGPGFDAARAMGILDELAALHFPVQRLTFLDREGHTEASVAYPPRRRRMFHGRHFNFLRGDLEAVLYERVRNRADIRFATTVSEVRRDDSGLDVMLTSGSSVPADVLIAADGVHWSVRANEWGSADRYTRELGYVTGAIMLDRVPDGADPHDFATLTVPGRIMAVYPVQGGGAAAFFAYRCSDPKAEVAEGAHTAVPRTFGDLEWVVPGVLAAIEARDDVYFDTVAQIQVDDWVRGRVALVGDAAWCVSLMAGQGASLALAGGKDVVDALAAGPDVEAQLARWQQRLRPDIDAAQRRGRRTASWFVPGDRMHIAGRNWLMRSAAWPVVGSLVGRSIGSTRAAS